MLIWDEEEIMSKFKPGEEVIVKKGTEDYTGRYAGTKVIIEKIYGNEAYNVVASDGVKFLCPEEYLEREGHKEKVCECGSHHTSFVNHHMFFCPLYKDNK